jgi:hypothetical protein
MGEPVAIRIRKKSSTEIRITADTASEIRSVLRRLGYDPDMSSGSLRKTTRIPPAKVRIGKSTGSKSTASSVLKSGKAAKSAAGKSAAKKSAAKGITAKKAARRTSGRGTGDPGPSKAAKR